MAKGRRSKSASLLSPQEIAATDGARRAELPARFKPQLATLASEVPQGDEWLHEIKFDGYRLLAFCDHGRARLVTRNGNDWTERFEAIAAALGELPLKSAILDGEVVSLNEGGQSDFQSLQNLMKRGKDAALVLYLFDVPYLEGYDLTQTPLLERKRLLAKIVHSSAPNNDGEVRYSDHIQGQGPNVLAHACRHAMEGVVSKRADSIYEQRRATSWLKIKCLKRQEFVIGGYTKPSGSRVGFGALLLGYYEDGRLRYAGRVGTGFTHESLRQLSSELKKRRVDASPFADPLRGSQVRGVTWARPEMVGEVEFTEWTSDGMLRHPSFQGIREDKPAEQIVREVAKSPAKLQSSTKPAGRPTKNRRSDSSAPSATTTRGNSSVAGIAITHPDRVLYPEQGITKRQLAKFYDGISDWILPYVVNRPLTLVRCPSGRAGQCFFQKHLTDSLPDALRGVTIQEKGKRAKYIVLDDTAGLISLVQMGVLEIHPWLAPADDVERPDRVVFDLDPGPDVPWGQVIAAAREIRRAIEQHDMESFVQTSGGKGLHVVIPLRPGRKWDAVKEFARSLAVELASRQPESYVATASTAKRKGKIFIDYLRNSRGATSVSPYSTRARRGAPVAVPVRWNELGKVTSADQFTVVSLPRRLSALKKDPWDGFFTVRQTL